MKYVCQICGYVYDEEKEGRPLSTLECCPLCKQPISNFHAVNDEKSSEYSADIFSDAAEPYLVLTEESYPEEIKPAPAAAYDKELVRHDPTARYMEEIHEMAVNGESLHAAMGTLLPLPAWEDILLLGAQLDPPPLDDDAAVSTRTIIGKKARKPMILETPVYISHMSFGALSREAKISLSKGSAMARTAMCSGEGGILSEEKEAAYRYIFEYIPNKYSVTDENLQTSDAIEIKIGQGTKPGMGGHLPGSKVTPEIAEVRGKKVVQKGDRSE